MKPISICFLLLPLLTQAQRIVSFDPVNDPVARRAPDGTLQLIVPFRVLANSIQETIPQITGINTIGVEKIGKSNYLMAGGKSHDNPENNYAVAILLVETAPGEFQADNLAISCSSTGDCRECSVPPVCTCDKGGGNCGQNSAQLIALKKVTVTLFD